MMHRRGSPTYWKSLLSMPREQAIAELDIWDQEEQGERDLVGTAEIALRLGVAQATVHSWRRRHADFPYPRWSLATGPLWLWGDVASWSERPRQTGRPRNA